MEVIFSEGLRVFECFVGHAHQLRDEGLVFEKAAKGADAVGALAHHELVDVLLQVVEAGHLQVVLIHSINHVP